MFLSTYHPHPLLLASGPVHIYWYGLLLAIGALSGLVVILRLGKRVGLGAGFLTDVFVFLVIGGFLGGRLYHVFNEWGYYSHHLGDIFRIWNGGLAIHGAMIVGLMILYIFARRQKISAWLLADVLVIGTILGQAIGRWGNYFNQELFGRPTSHAWKLIIDPTNRPVGYETVQFFHPAFLYESLGCLVIFFILLGLFRIRTAKTIPTMLKPWQPVGTITLTYFILYSLLRMVVESYRIDRVPLIAGLRLPILTSLIIIIAAGAMWVVRVLKKRPHEQGS